ncbi:MAG TPA: cysteine hydrolase, partial [Porphyromonadaceae bacterium]|nr:cysteine hydrolase [Porphyromonadaceae bacterium]
MTTENVKWDFEKERCVLMVIDMQNDFVLDGAIMQVKEAGRQIPKIQKLIATCRDLSIPVIYTVHKTDPAYCPLEIASFPWLKDAGMREGTDGIKVVDELKPAPNDMIIYKRRFSAFYQTDLEMILRNIGKPSSPADTLIICGTVTNICCESTARDAFFRDYKVVFGSDICSTDDKDA